jgi:hypothetical protein
MKVRVLKNGVGKMMKMVFGMLLLVGALSACQTMDHKTETAAVAPAANEEVRQPAADVDADAIRENGPRVKLEKCGGSDGSATMFRDYAGTLKIRVLKMECAYYKTPFMREEEKLNKDGNGFSGEFTVDESVPGYHTLTLGSKKYFNNPQPGSKADVLYFYVPARQVNLDLYFNQKAQSPFSIPNCGGYVTAKIVSSDQVTVDFKNVQNCSVFVMKGNGEEKAYNLQENQNGYFGSYTIPRDMIRSGANGTEIKLYTPRGKESRILVRFINWN